jgi:hypothetical protein
MSEPTRKPSKQERDFAQMYKFLKRIVAYQSQERMQRSSERDWGLPYEEALAMAYENIQQEAKNGLKGVRLMKTPTTALEAIHEAAEGLHKAGVIDKKTMKKF